MCEMCLLSDDWLPRFNCAAGVDGTWSQSPDFLCLTGLHFSQWPPAPGLLPWELLWRRVDAVEGEWSEECARMSIPQKKKHPSSPNSASTFRIRQEWEMNIRSVSHLHLPYSQRWCCRCHVCHVFCWAAWGLSSLFFFLSRLSNLEHRGFFHLNLFYCCRFFF